MKSKNLYSIRFKNIDDTKDIEKSVFEKVLESKDRKKYLGWIEERTYTTPKGKVIVESFIIKGTPSEEWRKAIEKAHLAGAEF